MIGSAPPERAGAASAISETGAELGGALGIAVLGSIGTAIYRSRVDSGIPAEVPIEASEAARDTLGGAVAASATLPVDLGEVLRGVASVAFVDAFQAVAVFSAVVLFAVAVVIGIVLRDVAVGGGMAGHGSDDEASMLSGEAAEPSWGVGAAD